MATQTLSQKLKSTYENTKIRQSDFSDWTLNNKTEHSVPTFWKPYCKKKKKIHLIQYPVPGIIKFMSPSEL